MGADEGRRFLAGDMIESCFQCFFHSKCIGIHPNCMFLFIYSCYLLQEVLLCKVNFKNEVVDRRLILYLNECGCGRKYCQEKAAYSVKNQLKKVNLKYAAETFLIEYVLSLKQYSCCFFFVCKIFKPFIRKQVK